MSASRQLEFTQVLHVPIAQVYRAFTNSTALREWLCEFAATDVRAGGRFYAWWPGGFYLVGDFVALQPPHLVSLKWIGKGEPGFSELEVTLKEVEGGVEVTLLHKGFGEGAAWDKRLSSSKRGWGIALENLKSVLEQGADLRITRRPMVGLTGSEDLTPEKIAQLCLPVKAGIQISGVVEGMGAARAGLQKDDVIVELAGKKIESAADFVDVIRTHHAGDTIPLEYYRGQERYSVQLTLSARPRPPLAENGAALADVAHATYASGDRELQKCLRGASEAAAERRPAPGEWSVKEVLAHLILSERGLVLRINDMLAGDEGWYDGFTGNPMAPIAGVIQVFPSLRELLKELKRCEAQTVATLAALPPEFFARKSTWWRLASTLPYLNIHAQDHLGQIREALRAAQ